MKLKFVFTSLLFFGPSAFASSADIAAMTAKLNQVDCSIQAQADPVRAIANRAAELVGAFGRKSQKDPAAFAALVRLEAAALPCQIDSEAATILENIRDTHPSLIQAFNEAIKTVRACDKAALLDAIENGDDDDARLAPNTKGAKIFSYAECRGHAEEP